MALPLPSYGSGWDLGGGDRRCGGVVCTRSQPHKRRSGEQRGRCRWEVSDSGGNTGRKRSRMCVRAGEKRCKRIDHRSGEEADHSRRKGGEGGRLSRQRGQAGMGFLDRWIREWIGSAAKPVEKRAFTLNWIKPQDRRGEEAREGGRSGNHSTGRAVEKSCQGQRRAQGESKKRQKNPIPVQGEGGLG
jgi:hypothetical protein